VAVSAQAGIGLTSAAAAEQLARCGPNDPVPHKRHSAILEFLRLFLNPLVVILLMAALASAALGEVSDASIIFAIVAVSNTLDFIQTRRSQNAIDQLRAQVAPTATVLRDGQWCELICTAVVPGDVVRLAAGDLVPADARLLESRDLYVQQAALTGESLPVEKQARAAAAAAAAVSGASPADGDDLVYLGTSVVSGAARALVLSTGAQTKFGDVAARLSSAPAPTAFDRGLRDFSLLITRTVTFLVLFLVLTALVRHRDALQSLLFAVALAVGLTPEFLPMIVSVTLSKGARAMARKKVIVKHLSAIQNFGSIDILCSDKTGTLTSGNMTLDAALDTAGNPSTRVLSLARLNSKFQTGIRSPLDEAILTASSAAELPGYVKRDEIPYDFERRRLSIVVEHESCCTLITKGAFEGIFARSIAYEGQAGSPSALDAPARAAIQGAYEKLSRQGLRVLAVGHAQVPPQASYGVADEKELVLAGFVTFSDKPLPDAAEAVAALRRQGVRLKILTGDSDLVSAHVCGQVGIDLGKIVLGDELDAMTDIALEVVAEQTTVFARTSPAQKNRILLALKRRGHVVGFMGDGINDAPSLHAADVGISVSSAVDVARAAADIILVEKGLDVLASGILEGRKAFGNVMKYLLMGTSSNFGNMFSMAGASLFLPFLPMLPTQILLNNFIYDLSQLTIPTDNVDEEYLTQPRQWDISLIRRFMIGIGPISSIFDFLTFYVLLHFFHADQAFFHTGWFVESLATQTLVIYVIRTARRNIFTSRPSAPLLISTLLAVAIGLALPYSPLAKPLGFVPLPASYVLYLAAATALYLLLVWVGKLVLARFTPPPRRLLAQRV
jgi:Mg2+-importing ATPase